MMIFLSHAVNVGVTFAVAAALLRDTQGMTDAYGGDAPARRILLCVYASIGLISLYALIRAATGAPDIAARIGLTLFPLQIVYKLLTAALLGVSQPVVIANLMIVALHTATLLTAF